jgi:hypothetical protein
MRPNAHQAARAFDCNSRKLVRRVIRDERNDVFSTR